MESEVVTAAEEITAGRLTVILQRAGLLESGRVQGVTVEGNPAFNSALCHLLVTYDSAAPGDAPRALVLKRNLPEAWAREAGKSEVDFYAEVSGLRDELPMIVPCYEAAYDPRTGDSHLLLLDVSTSHEPLTTREDLIGLRGVPAAARLDAAIDALARLHAHWWEHPSLLDGSRDVSGWYGTRQRFDAYVKRRRREWEEVLVGPGRDLPPDLRRLYPHALDRLPVLWERGLGQRVTTGNNLTLVHGDCFLSQYLSPRDGAGITYLVDWQGAYTDLPSIDLTHLFATFWTPEQRHEEDRDRLLTPHLNPQCHPDTRPTRQDRRGVLRTPHSLPR